MTAHNYQDYGIGTAADMTFDEVFTAHDANSPTMEKPTAKETATRLVSAPYDEQQQQHAVSPVSPCMSEETSASLAAQSVTGQLRNIEYRYHVDAHVLGEGHHGSVRACVDRITGKRYAVKSVRKSDPSVKPGQLAREISLLRQIDHRSIIQLVDVYEDAEYVHIVTSLCEGGELFDRISERATRCEIGSPCFSEEEAAKILHQLLVAISYMHKHGIVHRDIKPENILFETKDEDSPLKIVDFGLARRHDASLEPPMTSLLGTPYYIAPDVLKKSYDKSCDLWSVGIIAYILMSGYPPFNGATNADVHAAVLKGKYRFSATDWSGTSREVRDFIRALLQRDPRKRMTAEQALNHPWMVRHIHASEYDASMMMCCDDEDRQDESSVEVVFKGEPARDSIICDSPQRSSKRGRAKRIPLFNISFNI